MLRFELSSIGNKVVQYQLAFYHLHKNHYWQLLIEYLQLERFYLLYLNIYHLDF